MYLRINAFALTGRVFKIHIFLHGFAAANARAELSCKPNTIKLA